MSEKLNRYSPHYDHDEERVSMSIDDSGDWVHIVRAKELMQERDEALRTKEGIKKFYSPEAAASLRAELAQSQALAALREHERDEARAEVERLRGVPAELPPRPPEGYGMPRYGLRWNGPTEPVAVPLNRGYWTPWHLAAAEVDRLGEENRKLYNSLQGADSGMTVALREVAERQREACAKALDGHDGYYGLSGSVARKLVRETPLVREEEP